MLSTQEFGSVVRFVAATVGVYLAWRMILVPSINDWCRQRLFEQRRRLLELAMDELIAVDDPAYIETRELLNTMLFVAERFTLTRIMIAVANPQRPRRVFAKPPPAAEAQVNKIVSDSINITMLRSMVTSLFAILTTVMLLAYAIIFRKPVREAKTTVREQAAEIGHIAALA